MTEYQKQKIPQLRSTGMGYKAIANVLGLTRDVVRGFCKKYGLEGNGMVIKQNIETKISKGILCANCSKPVTQPKSGRQRRFCSDECRRTWWKVNTDKRKPKDTALYHFKCVCCNKTFESYGNQKRKYCSHECYIKDRFKQKENTHGIQKT